MRRWPLLMLALARCSPAALLNALTPDSGVHLTRNVRYAPGDRHTLDIYTPTATHPRATVVFLYGGAWRSGAKETYRFVGNTLARTGLAVAIPDYRLYPTVCYPDFLRDGAGATAAVLADPARFPRPVFLMGHSAGAYNAAMLALDTRWLTQAGGDPAAIAGLIGLAGPYDFLPMTGDTRAVFGAAADDPDTQPVRHARHDAPAALLLAGADDQTVKPRNTLALAAALRGAGAAAETRLYPGLGHVGLVLAIAPLFQWRAPVLADIAAAVGKTDTGVAARPGSVPNRPAVRTSP